MTVVPSNVRRRAHIGRSVRSQSCVRSESVSDANANVRSCMVAVCVVSSCQSRPHTHTKPSNAHGPFDQQQQQRFAYIYIHVAARRQRRRTTDERKTATDYNYLSGQQMEGKGGESDGDCFVSLYSVWKCEFVYINIYSWCLWWECIRCEHIYIYKKIGSVLWMVGWLMVNVSHIEWDICVNIMLDQQNQQQQHTVRFLAHIICC